MKKKEKKKKKKKREEVEVEVEVEVVEERRRRRRRSWLPPLPPPPDAATNSTPPQILRIFEEKLNHENSGSRKRGLFGSFSLDPEFLSNSSGISPFHYAQRRIFYKNVATVLHCNVKM